MATRNTRTAFTDVNGNNCTATHLTTNIIIKSGNYVVGAVQTLSITESRSIKMIDEVGTDGHIDSAPSASTNITGNCTRVRFNRQKIADAFGRSFTHVHAQRIPFDIEIHDVFADADTNNAVVTTIHQAWIKEISYDYSATDWVISDKMTFEAEAISSIMANKNVVTGVANGQDGPIYINQFEQEADRGVYRGALDAAGVLNAFIDDPSN